MVIFGMTNMKFVPKLRFFRNIIPDLIGMFLIFNLFINVIIINNQQKNLIIPANHKKNVRMSECQEFCQNVRKIVRMSGKLSEYLKHIIIIIKDI